MSFYMNCIPVTNPAYLDSVTKMPKYCYEEKLLTLYTLIPLNDENRSYLPHLGLPYTLCHADKWIRIQLRDHSRPSLSPDEFRKLQKAAQNSEAFALDGSVTEEGYLCIDKEYVRNEDFRSELLFNLRENCERLLDLQKCKGVLRTLRLEEPHFLIKFWENPYGKVASLLTGGFFFFAGGALWNLTCKISRWSFVPPTPLKIGIAAGIVGAIILTGVLLSGNEEE